MAAPAIEGAGTTERVWLPFLASLDLPALDLSRPPGRVVVVAPHPDDEVLGVGGLLSLLAALGTAIDVVAVTDGEASHPGGSIIASQLATLRAQETATALARLGVPTAVQRLGLPDGGRDELETPVADALRVDPGTWLIGPWEGDGHPDHEAVGRACVTAARRAGARLLAYPVWAWHWSSPVAADLPWERASAIHLDDAVRSRKARAIDAFVSQTHPIGPAPADAPVLPAHVLARFARPFEVVFA